MHQIVHQSIIFLLLPQPPTSTLFPYTTLFRSSSVLISTKANPRARPVAMSRITFTVSTVPARANRSWSSASPVSYGKFPTYNFRPMIRLLCRETRQHQRRLDGAQFPRPRRGSVVRNFV